MLDGRPRRGRADEAGTMWPAAAGLTLNARESEWLLRRAHNTLPEGDKP
jgi:hypothetical protein